MKTLFSGGKVINVFTGEIEYKNVLIEDSMIVGVGDYTEDDADRTVELGGKYICPGFIDSHIHIESTMLLPYEFSNAVLPHGTTAVVADPHEIANVAGEDGIRFMLEASEGLPVTVYIMLPSCVPATCFDEAGAVLDSYKLEGFYSHPRVLGLGEVMDYVSVVNRSPDVIKKIMDCQAHGLRVNGHAPLLSGETLDRYIAEGIGDDHECSSAEEAIDRVRRGQRVMIRYATAAKNLYDLLPLFEPQYASRCLLATDDKHPSEILKSGHIDAIIREVAACGKDPVAAIRMATVQAAEYFGLKKRGAIAPGYFADIVVLDGLDTVGVSAVYKEGVHVSENGVALPQPEPRVPDALREKMRTSFHVPEITKDSFKFEQDGVHSCRVIGVNPGQLLTDELHMPVDFGKNNGIDTERDTVKLAVIERHSNTGHIGLGFVHGLEIKHGALASSVSHDSHNLIVIGACEEDMAAAANRVLEMGGGNAVVDSGEVIAEMALPYGGLMTELSAEEAARVNADVLRAAGQLGEGKNLEPFMHMAFVSLSVIPHLKMTTHGLCDVDSFKTVELFVE